MTKTKPPVPACLRLFVTVLITALACTGCTRTTTGGFQDSPDKKFRLYIRVYGAYGRAFAEDTEKRLRVSIITNDPQERILFARDYEIRGSEVCWSPRWDEHDSVRVNIYDYGRGVSSYTVRNTNVSTNHLLSLSYRFVPNTGKFEEQSPK